MSSELECNQSDLRDTLDMVIEECAEVIQAASKAKRFGLIDSWDGATNRQKLENEIGDLLCLIEILTDNGVLDTHAIEKALCAKAEKMKKWAPTVAKYWKG
jgi:NTP pyrophosphatase (non-canonical NTP hydrolase)